MSRQSNQHNFGGVKSDNESTLRCTPVNEIANIVSSARKSFLTGKTLDVKFRKQQLLQLYKMLDENQDAFVEAVYGHLKRPKNEIFCSEISASLSEIAHLYNNVDKYVKPKVISTTIAFMTDRAELNYTPLGNVIIMSTWNFPLNLLLVPLAGAIAAGCSVIIRPSEITDKVSDLIYDLTPKYLDKSLYKVIVGGVQQNIELLKQNVDLIFFTGSPRVGKIVSKAASAHLTPVVLELGGKNPTIIDESNVDLKVAAKRIAWGRWAMNTGQICLAPEYVIINKNKVDEFIECLKDAITEFFGKNVQQSSEYGRIINDNHFRRLVQVLNNDKDKIVYGGETDKSSRFIHPTIMYPINNDSKIMEDEVFGPILSIYPVDNVQKEAIPIITSYEKPLAMYIFSKNQHFIEKVVKLTDAGGVTINDTIMHFACPGLPFGGVGTSGCGRYHGQYSFLAFSHEKPVLHKYHGLEFMNDVRYPPFTDQKKNIWRKAAEEKIEGWTKYIKPLLTAASIGGFGYYLQSKL